MRRDVGGTIEVVVVCRFSVFGYFSKSVGRSVLSGESGVDVGAEGLLESVDAGEACLWVVGSVGGVGDLGGADGVSVFVGFKEFWSVKECWSVWVLAHGRQVWPMCRPIGATAVAAVS
jgi:hypothetical protein